MRPTKIYVKEILNLIERNLINGCANITGGGIKDNVKRILPSHLSAYIDLNKVRPKSIFKWIHNQGVNEKEMLKNILTLNDTIQQKYRQKIQILTRFELSQYGFEKFFRNAM